MISGVTCLISHTTDDDFSGLPQSLSFTESGEECINIAITMDSLLEEPEDFFIVLATRDPDINFDIRTAQVYILDSDSECALHSTLCTAGSRWDSEIVWRVVLVSISFFSGCLTMMLVHTSIVVTHTPTHTPHAHTHTHTHIHTPTHTHTYRHSHTHAHTHTPTHTHTHSHTHTHTLTHTLTLPHSHTHTHTHTLTVLTIGFEQMSYDITEWDEGVSLLEVCLTVSGGTVDRSVVISVSDQDGTATGK